MEFRVFFRQMDSSLPTYAYAEMKLKNQLEKYALKATSLHVTIASERGEFSVACNIIGPGLDFHAQARDAMSAQAAIDLLARKIDGRLTRRKTRLLSMRQDGHDLPLNKANRDAVGSMPREEDYVDAAAVLAYERRLHRTGKGGDPYILS